MSGTAAKLAALVEEHGKLEMEGFKWLPCNLEVLASHMGVAPKTIERVIKKAPFRYLVRFDSSQSEDGKPKKYILLRVGGGMAESDHLNVLKDVWAKGLIAFNAALVPQLEIQLLHLKAEKKRNSWPGRRSGSLLRERELNPLRS